MSSLPSEPAPQRLRIATWNLKWCDRGVPGVVSLLRDCGADVVGLQEVDRGTRRSHGFDQTALLAERAGYAHHQFFRAISIRGGDFGVAVLSRYPLAECRAGLLPSEDYEQRVHASAVVELPGGPLSLHVTHLTNYPSQKQLRALQVRRILDRIGATTLPAVLLGDFNDVPDSLAYRTICTRMTDAFHAKGSGPGGTFPLPLLSDRRIDYVFASRDVEVLAAEVVRTEASDHYLLRAELGVPRAAAAGRMVSMLGF